MALRSVAYATEAQWNGQWKQLGQAALAEEHIVALIDKFCQDRMQSTGQPAAPPEGQVSAVCSRPSRAGEWVEVMVTVKNVGKGEFYKLAAQSESDVPRLSGLKLQFGKLLAGESLSLPLRAQLPAGQAAGPMQVRLKWSELNGYTPEPTSVTVVIAR
jgi:hypothetical protein